MTNRNEQLKREVAASPKSLTACLVYADWLAERGETQRATAWRVLGGGDASPREVEETAILAAAVALWLLEPRFAIANDDDVDGLFGVFFSDCRAAIAQALRKPGEPADDDEGDDDDADDDEADDGETDGEGDEDDEDDEDDAPSPDAIPELKELRRLIRGLGARDFRSTALAARALVPGPAFVRAVEHLASTPRSPFERDPRVADALRAGVSNDDLEAPLLPMRPFCFDHVQITNSTTGIEGRVTNAPARGAWHALLSTAADLELEAGAWGELSREDRGEFVEVELGFDDETRWKALSHFDALEELFQFLGSNEGNDVRVGEGEHRPLLDVLDELGPFVAGARDTTDFPRTLLEFERGWVSLHFSY